MATWQATVDLVPRARAVALTAEPLTGKFFEWEPDLADVDWWVSDQPPRWLAERLDALASRAVSWAADLEMWGNADGNRIDVWRDAGHVDSISVRFDMRAPDEGFVLGVAALARDLGCLFYSQEHMLVDATPDALATLLRQSPALRFVRDPLAFLQRVRLGGYEDA